MSWTILGTYIIKDFGISCHLVYSCNPIRNLNLYDLTLLTCVNNEVIWQTKPYCSELYRTVPNALYYTKYVERKELLEQNASKLLFYSYILSYMYKEWSRRGVWYGSIKNNIVFPRHLEEYFTKIFSIFFEN